MNNTEKLAWINDMNAHLAAGGKFEVNYGSHWRDASVAPNWYSDPIQWRKVPLSRKATIRVAYRWLSDASIGPQFRFMHDGEVVVGNDWQVAEIEVTEQVK